MAELNLDILGTSGLYRTGGYILEEFLRQLKGPKGLELLKEFTHNNPQAGAIRSLLHSLVRQVTWDVTSAEECLDHAASERAELLVRTSMDDMEHSWHDYIAESLSMVEYGFAPFEIVYKMRRGPGGPKMVESKFDDGMIGWRKVELRSQDSIERWEFDPDTFDLKGMWQRDNYVSRYVYIPIERLIHFRTEKFKNNPEGRSLFRNAIIPYLRLKHIEDIEAIGIERDLTGLPTMEVPADMLHPNAPAEKKQLRREVERIMGAIKSNERGFALLPASKNMDGTDTGWLFRLMASPGQRAIDIVKVKDSYKTDILQVFLAQFLQMGVQSNAVGSFAQHDSATNLFGLALGSMLDNLEETINRQQVDPLLEINNFAPQDYCSLKHGDVETPDLEKLGGYLRELFTAGFVGPNSEKLKQKLYDFAGLPYEPAEEMSDASQTPQGVKTADQLIAEVMGGNAPGAAGQGVAPAGGVKTADQLIAEVMPNGVPSANQAQPGAAPSPAMPAVPGTPGAPAVDGAALTADTAKVADTAMNGAQLSGMLAVVSAVADGTIPRDSGIAQLQIGFRLSVEDATKVMGSAGAGFTPTAPPAPVFGGGGGKPGGAPPFGGKPAAPAGGPVKSADDLIAEATKPK